MEQGYLLDSKRPFFPSRLERVGLYDEEHPVGFSKYVPTSSQAMTPFSPPYHFNHIASLIPVCFRLVSFPADR